MAAIVNAPHTVQETSISLDLIDPHPDAQTGRKGDKVCGLSKDIAERGFDQPLDVIRNVDRFYCIGGLRRLMAAKLSGLKEAPVRIHDGLDRKQIALRMTADVLHSKAHNAIQQYRMLKAVEALFEITMPSRLASLLHVSKPRVSKLKAFDSIEPANLARAEELGLGTDSIYYISSEPSERHADLIELCGMTTSKTFIKQFQKGRVVTKVRARQENHRVNVPDVCTIRYQCPRNLSDEDFATVLHHQWLFFEKNRKLGLKRNHNLEKLALDLEKQLPFTHAKKG